MARGVRRAKPSRTAVVTAVPSPPAIPARAAQLCALAVFLTAFIIYLRTLIPTTVDQDSGELVTAAHVLGVAHPTGYPFWTLLARLFDYLPLGHTSAYRVALLSAVSVAIAAGLLAWITISLTGLLLPGVFAGLGFAFWLPTWSQAVLAEVYGLEALLFALFLLSMFRWERERRPRQLYGLALSVGFVAMHHRTGALAALPALGVAALLTRPQPVRPRARQSRRTAQVWLTACLLAVIPFLFYLYLPVRAAAKPPLNWGNADTFERFLAHASGRQYAPWAFENDFGEAMTEGGRLLRECLSSPGWPSWVLVTIGLPFLLWGLVFGLGRRAATIGSLTVGTAVLCAWVLGYGDTSDSKVWLIPAGAVLALLGGLGASRLAVRLSGKMTGQCAITALGAATCILLLWGNWARADRSNMWGHRDAWVASLSQTEGDSLFVTHMDAPTFVTYYLQYVEGMAKPLTVVNTPLLSNPWYSELIEDEELRRAVLNLWGQVAAEYDLSEPGTADYWNGAARFAHLLAKHYQGRRTVYALHGPVTPFPDPPYFVGLGDGFYRLDFALPEMVRMVEPGKPIVEFPQGVNLISFELAPATAKAGAFVEFRARWQLEEPLPGMLFAIRLLPAREELRPVWQQLLAKSCFQQGYPVLYGLWYLSATPPGTVYEQRGRYIIPSNCPSGDYHIQIGYAQSLPPTYRHWVELDAPHAVRVRAQPFPTNGP